MKNTNYVSRFQMVSLLVSCYVEILFLVIFTVFSLPTYVSGFGSSSTIAVSYGSNTVCGILAGKSSQGIQCFQGGELFSIRPNMSYEALAGGKNMFCGLTSGGIDLFCWDTRFSDFSTRVRQIYHNPISPLTDLTVGTDRVCALQARTSIIQCWERARFSPQQLFLQPEGKISFQSITSGDGFSCGIVDDDKSVSCWGENGIGDFIEAEFDSMSMLTLVAGKSHVCGITVTGILVCKGKNDSGQLDVPSETPFYYSDLALGGTYSCALLRSNGSVACWGNAGNVSAIVDQEIQTLSFESIVSGTDFTCGLRSDDLTLLCWGPGWSDKSNTSLGLSTMIPGPCVRDPCQDCGTFPNSASLCSGEANICRSCVVDLPFQRKSSDVSGPAISPASLSLPVSSTPQHEKKVYRPFWVYETFGMVGFLCGLVALGYFLYLRISRPSDEKLLVVTKKELRSTASKCSNGSQNADTAIIASTASSAPQSRSSSITQFSSLASGRERNWEFSLKHVDKAEVFSLSELALATRNFSLENKIGRGSFGTVYKGKLPDGREVAVKREVICRTKDREYAFESELTLLSRVHHKHLVGLVGFCEENSERLLVYEFMANGALHDMLHNTQTNNTSRLNSWKMRIKVALDAARGIEYLHNYAVPPIIHRDIKTSNILLDTKWVGRVSDFGLSLKGPETEEGSMSIKAAGTVGYIDPEYYVLKVLTTKSDVYGFGVVLLELLTGKKAVFKEIEGNGPTGVVEYAGPFIVGGEVWKVLDKRVEQPVMNESEAVELLAYTAMMCVNLEGKERPTMSDVVSNLERALALCKGSSGTFSPNFYSFN
ncbi:putative serine/threonine-protein kinase-like protein CCR3 [Silene latifolia]|uniref:putative serine/threonine-protein kinase-like protein CCR3 n=1 Tax=Silene latifolia TaxID=37657 RepID=UPI003D788F57